MADEHCDPFGFRANDIIKTPLGLTGRAIHNFIFIGVPFFSSLEPTCRRVRYRGHLVHPTQALLALEYAHTLTRANIFATASNWNAMGWRLCCRDPVVEGRSQLTLPWRCLFSHLPGTPAAPLV